MIIKLVIMIPFPVFAATLNHTDEKMQSKPKLRARVQENTFYTSLLVVGCQVVKVFLLLINNIIVTVIKSIHILLMNEE